MRGGIGKTLFVGDIVERRERQKKISNDLKIPLRNNKINCLILKGHTVHKMAPAFMNGLLPLQQGLKINQELVLDEIYFDSLITTFSIITFCSYKRTFEVKIDLW